MRFHSLGTQTKSVQYFKDRPCNLLSKTRKYSWARRHRNKHPAGMEMEWKQSSRRSILSPTEKGSHLSVISGWIFIGPQQQPRNKPKSTRTTKECPEIMWICLECFKGRHIRTSLFFRKGLDFIKLKPLLQLRPQHKIKLH